MCKLTVSSGEVKTVFRYGFPRRYFFKIKIVFEKKLRIRLRLIMSR